MQNQLQLRKTISLLLRTGNDVKESAKAVKLKYNVDAQKGITRVKKNKTFAYFYNDKIIRDKKTLKRIASLVIPPAWENVWISPDEKGHLQATGFDIKKRKQYKYHPHWNSIRNHTKFSNMLEYGKTLPHMRKQLDKDISQNSDLEKKVIALVISLMDKTYIRVGGKYYEKLYGSYGLTTLKDKHVQINGSSLTFLFKGKKGVNHNITLRNSKLARMVKQCKDIPGKELFQYYASDGIKKSIDSGLVNNYIKEITKKQFTSKDFRTWAGSVIALRKILEIQQAGQIMKLNHIIEHVSKQLGNTVAVCKKYYVHPMIQELYEQNKLSQLTKINSSKNKFLSNEESVLIQLLLKYKGQQNFSLS